MNATTSSEESLHTESEYSNPIWKHLLAEYDESPDYRRLRYENGSITDSLSRSFVERLTILRTPIDEISGEIRVRELLTRALNEEVDFKAKKLRFLVRELDTWTMGYNDSIENRRIWLQKEILNLEKEKRAEKLRFWEDVVSLANKRREFIMEYETLSRISRIL